MLGLVYGWFNDRSVKGKLWLLRTIRLCSTTRAASSRWTSSAQPRATTALRWGKCCPRQVWSPTTQVMSAQAPRSLPSPSSTAIRGFCVTVATPLKTSQSTRPSTKSATCLSKANFPPRSNYCTSTILFAITPCWTKTSKHSSESSHVMRTPWLCWLPPLTFCPPTTRTNSAPLTRNTSTWLPRDSWPKFPCLPPTHTAPATASLTCTPITPSTHGKTSCA